MYDIVIILLHHTVRRFYLVVTLKEEEVPPSSSQSDNGITADSSTPATVCDLKDIIPPAKIARSPRAPHRELLTHLAKQIGPLLRRFHMQSLAHRECDVPLGTVSSAAGYVGGKSSTPNTSTPQAVMRDAAGEVADVESTLLHSF